MLLFLLLHSWGTAVGFCIRLALCAWRLAVLKPCQAAVGLGLRGCAVSVNLWSQVLDLVGVETALHVSQHQAARSGEQVAELQKTVALQQQELQELREQLAICSHVKSTLQFKYQQVKVLNKSLQQALQDMETASAAAAKAVRHHNAIAGGQQQQQQACWDSATNEISPAVKANAMAHRSFAKPRPGMLSKAARANSSPLHDTVDSPFADEAPWHGKQVTSWADIHAVSSSAAKQGQSAPVRQASQQAQPEKRTEAPTHRGASGGVAWGTHLAVLMSFWAMRWLTNISEPALTALQQQQQGTRYGMPAIVWLPGSANLPCPSKMACWLLMLAYALWLVRLLPARALVSYLLLGAAWVMVGYCLHAGWLCGLLLQVLPGPGKASTTGGMGSSAGVSGHTDLQQSSPMMVGAYASSWPMGP